MQGNPFSVQRALLATGGGCRDAGRRPVAAAAALPPAKKAGEGGGGGTGAAWLVAFPAGPGRGAVYCTRDHVLAPMG